jgi:hypothetical protein
MQKWMVKLSGHEFDLRALASLYNEPACRVAKDDDGAYYLTRAAFDTLTEASEVARAAREWLPIANELMRLLSLGYESVSLDGVYENMDGGDRRHHILLSGTLSAHSRMYGELTVLGPDGQPVPSPEPARAQARLKLAESDTKVKIALSCWRNCTIGDAGLWVYAYKVYEIIRADVGVGDKRKGRQEIEERLWASSTEIDGFGEAANNPAVSGDTARHGVEWKTRDGVVPFNEGQALTFIQRLLNHWLDWKLTPTS